MFVMMKHCDKKQKVKKQINVREDRKGNTWVLGTNLDTPDSNIKKGSLFVVDMNGYMQDNTFENRANTNYKMTFNPEQVIYKIKVGDMVKEVDTVLNDGNIFGYAWIVQKITDGKAVGQLDYEYVEMGLQNAERIEQGEFIELKFPEM